MPKELSAVEVRRLPPGRHWVADNLYIEKDPLPPAVPLETPADPGSWIFNYVSPVTGKRQYMGLGSAALVSVRQAKETALEYRLAVLKGRCPLTERRAATTARKADQTGRVPTFEKAVARYLKDHEKGWRSVKHRDQWETSLTAYALPVIGKLTVDRITTDDVLAILRPIWAAKTVTASRVRQRLEAVLDYASAQRWRSDANPARWKGHLQRLLPAHERLHKKQHYAALPWRELPGLYQALADQEGVTALCLRYTLLTALRSSEVFGTCREEIDWTGKVHVVPGNRTKTAKPMRVPLSVEAMAVLDAAEAMRSSELLFGGARPGKPLAPTAMRELLATLCPGTKATVHGTSRSAFRDWCAEYRVDRDLAERALGHATAKNETEAAYLRNDLLEPRRPVMERWAEFLTAPAKVQEIPAAA